jgi:hypothetical protein
LLILKELFSKRRINYMNLILEMIEVKLKKKLEEEEII